MKIQVYSDLHLEFYKEIPKIPCCAQYLFLAGDIGKISCNSYQAFIQYCSEKWVKVYVVLGNHEFYHSKKTYDILLEKYKEFINKFDNVYLLEKECCCLEDFTILGLTYWSHISSNCENIVNCPKKIKISKKYENGNKQTVPIGINNYNQLHMESVEWLNNNYNPNKKTIIITHYPLTQQNTLQKRLLYEKGNIDRMNVFSNNVEFTPHEKLVCISGHTHYSHDFTENNVRYISNQMGYKDEAIKNFSNFDCNGVYDL